jgi:hypothetical protein
MFLENHLGSTVAIDFFTVPSLTYRILFVLVVLAHDRRRILHVNVTHVEGVGSMRTWDTADCWKTTCREVMAKDTPRRPDMLA